MLVVVWITFTYIWSLGNILEDDKTEQEEIEHTQDIDWWNTSTEDN